MMNINKTRFESLQNEDAHLREKVHDKEITTLRSTNTKHKPWTSSPRPDDSKSNIQRRKTELCILLTFNTWT